MSYARSVLLARRVFGDNSVDEAIQRVVAELQACGFRCRTGLGWETETALATLLLRSGSADLAQIDAAVIHELDRSASLRLRRGVRLVVLALRRAGAQDGSVISEHGNGGRRRAVAVANVPASWIDWVERWAATSTLTPQVRSRYSYVLFQAGRWLDSKNRAVAEPAAWTRQTAVSWVAAVDRMTIGQWASGTATGGPARRVGEPLSPRTKEGHICALRTFFRDIQEWEWVPRRFDPARALATPSSIRALIGPDPRCISEDVWAKVMSAGLNLAHGDLPAHRVPESGYPFEMVRALAVVWLFAGLRSDEIVRLRSGCIRWQDAHGVALLEVPANKTGTAFTKPVDPVVGKAIDAWDAVRPTQPPSTNPKTAEAVHFLFSHRGRRIGRGYINQTLIPMLCRKANVPRADRRGPLTSHRARSTIATQLYNAKDPMTLFEL